MKKKRFNLCTILRVKDIESFTLNIYTGKKGESTFETVIEECETPLFSDEEQKTGICKACHAGFEMPGNTFANEYEKQRALRGV